jgi:malate dehydrogenase
MALKGKVTVVGAGFYGSTTALRLAEYNIFETGGFDGYRRRKA